MQVKICCIKNVEEAELAIKAGADVIGLVGQMPSGPGVISDVQISNIVAWNNNAVKTFLLTSEVEPAKIIQHHRRTRTSSIQLVDRVATSCYPLLREQLPGIEIVQVIHIQDESAIDLAKQISPNVDVLLLDSGNPKLKIKTFGGTGKTHDWTISARIVQAVDIPVFLAGGLSPLNVNAAITQVNPFGIDVCSGVRSKGQLDPEKLMAFMRMIKE